MPRNLLPLLARDSTFGVLTQCRAQNGNQSVFARVPKSTNLVVLTCPFCWLERSEHTVSWHGHIAAAAKGSISVGLLEARATFNSYIFCRFNQYSGVMLNARPRRKAVSAVIERRP